ncbi:MAG: DUF4129 domain-containing protein [Candidatus Tectimicrobiota bacterium]
MRQWLSPGLCLCLALGGAVLYLSGLAATLQLGDANLPGMLLIPALPRPLYVVLAVVVGAGVSVTLLAALRQRRRPLDPEQQRQSEALRSPWATLLSSLGSLALGLTVLLWLLRHGPELQEFLARLRLEMGLAQELIEGQTQGRLQQVHSSTTGYAMFLLILLVYGGIGALGLWILWESYGKVAPGVASEAPQTRHVRRAMAAGLQELRLHADPRQAIIACYARLEHLLADHGAPVAATLTPQESMGEALRELMLPLQDFAELVQLFELARYSLHPLDQAARTRAITCLERLQEALAQEPAHALHA